MKVGLLSGGNSTEREVSLSSGKSIYKACRDLGYQVKILDPIDGIRSIKDSILSVDIIFNGLHGGDGENGEVAKYLESLNIPYTGSDQLSSATCMDKNKTKTIVFENNFLTPGWVMKNKDSDDIIDIDLTFPLVVKPNDQGSTIGLSIVKNKKELRKAFELAGNYTSSILLESFINGREITVPVVANKAYSIVEIIPSHDLYDYECKYTKGMSEYICPADLSINLSESIKELALKVHKILNCRHYSRVDFLLDKNNDPWFLEINTLPGMTETSLLPKSLKASGIEFKDIIQKILNEAIKS